MRLKELQKFDTSIVWRYEPRALRHAFGWVDGKAYRDANDPTKFVGLIDPHTGAGCPFWGIYDIQFGFKTLRAARAWVRSKRSKVENKVRKDIRKHVAQEQADAVAEVVSNS